MSETITERGSAVNHAVDRRQLLQAMALPPSLALAAFSSADAANTTGAFAVIAELVSKPDRADAPRGILAPFMEGVCEEPGC